MAQRQSIVDSLRCPPLPMALRPPGAVVYGEDRSVISSDDGARVDVVVAIAVPTPTTVPKALLQVGKAGWMRALLVDCVQ